MSEPNRPRVLRPLLWSLLLAMSTPTPGLAVLAKGASAAAKNVPPTAGSLSQRHAGDLAEIRQHKVLRVLVAYNRTDFFYAGKEPRGFAYQVMREYEKFLNQGVRREDQKVRVKWIPVSPEELITGIQEGRGDLAAAILPVTPKHLQQVDFVTQRIGTFAGVVVGNAALGPLQSLKGLAGKRVYLPHNSRFIAPLRDLSQQLLANGLEAIEIRATDARLSAEDVLEMVNAGMVDFTLTEGYKANLWGKVLPDIRIYDELRLAADGVGGFAVRHNNPELKASLETFLQNPRLPAALAKMPTAQPGKASRWLENPIDDAARPRFRKHARLFKKYASRYGFDYRTLMAVAYQETGLDQRKRGISGSVGMMQLLPSTARDRSVKIANIDRLENNVQAGSKYLAFLRDQYFADSQIPEEDRLAFIWAAFNAGPHPILHLREDAKKHGLDPNRWFGNVELVAGKSRVARTAKYVSDVYKYYLAYQSLAAAS
jgi:membrane-bound lytic murein transglycosylase MltF